MKRELKILVTGGAGFIGSNLVRKLLQLNYEVVVFDNLQTGSLKNIAEFSSNRNFTFIKGNVNDYDDIAPVFFMYRFSYVYHYSASVGVKRTLDNPLEVLNDIDGIKNVLNLCKSTGVKRVFYASSSEVYGEAEHFPENEFATPLNARLPYAAVKNIGEVFIRAYQKEFGLPYTIFRFFNTFGPKQSNNFVVSRFINQALKNEDITINGSGDQTRTFLYISDNITPTVKALSFKDTINKTINIGSDNEITMNKLATLIIKLTRSSSKIVHLPPLEEGDMNRRLPDIALMTKIFKSGRNESFEKGLLKTIEYFKHE